MKEESAVLGKTGIADFDHANVILLYKEYSGYSLTVRISIQILCNIILRLLSL